MSSTFMTHERASDAKHPLKVMSVRVTSSFL